MSHKIALNNLWQLATFHFNFHPFTFHKKGLNQLLVYYSDLEKAKCYSLPGGLPDWDNQGDACMKWRRFGK